MTGLGIKGRLPGREVAVGDDTLAEIDREIRTLGGTSKTELVVAIDGAYAGHLVIADAIKDNAAGALAELRSRGIRIVIATGDSALTARTVAKELGIQEVHAEVLPEDKSRLISELKARGRKVAFAGDGINNAPALATADVGIAMGTAADVAIESASITLPKGDIPGVVRAHSLAQATLQNIRQSLGFAFGYNAIGIPIAADVLYPVIGTLLSPIVAAAAMSLSSVSVIGNALRLGRKRF